MGNASAGPEIDGVQSEHATEPLGDAFDTKLGALHLERLHLALIVEARRCSTLPPCVFNLADNALRREQHQREKCCAIDKNSPAVQRSQELRHQKKYQCTGDRAPKPAGAPDHDDQKKEN